AEPSSETSPAVGSRVGASRRWPWAQDRRGRAIELTTLCGLAIAQPVFAVMGENTAELVALQADGAALVLFAVGLVTVPPAVLWLLEEAVERVSPSALRVAHPVLLGVLFALFAAQLFGDVPAVPAVVVLAGAVGAGAAFVAMYRRWAPVRLWLRYLAVACVAFLVAFLVLSPVRRLILPPPVTVVAAPPEDRPDVVVLILDELPTLDLLRPDGSIDAERFPAFARMVSTSTWYRNSTTSAAWTVLAVPAIMTGRYPEDTLAPMTADHPDSLFTLLGGAYDLNVWESVTRICPSSLCPTGDDHPPLLRQVRGLAQLSGAILRQRTSPFEKVERRMQFDAAGPAPTRPDQFRAFVDSIQPGERPSLDLLHVGLPHQPYLTLPSGAAHDGPDTPPGLVDGNTWLHDLAAGAGHQAHLLAAQATDRLLGDLLDRLEATGQFDDAIVVVTADHGVAFDAALPYRAMTPETSDVVAYPPLFIKYPGQRSAAVSDVPAESVDIVPTIAEVVDIPIPWPVDGVSLLDESAVVGPQRFQPYWIDEVVPGPDGYAEIDAVPFDQRVARQRQVIDDVVDDRALFALPGGADLVGADVTDLDVVGEPVTATIGFAGADRTVRAGEPVPAFVLSGFDAPPDGSIAVAVDGRIALTGAAAVVDGQVSSFWGFLPEAALPAGDHRIELYVVTGAPGSEQLRPVTLRPRS
ncbi:MAG: sulfatase-like hydrolase/transferase, partial [Acidimicrobiales bacterium]|nr:sulfatase-like hydrolase/transferase [Acidimicrobiales bacterium]